ncbi:hypothetical protein AOLI_G00319610 [Acnodon oligacanthus]
MGVTGTQTADNTSDSDASASRSHSAESGDKVFSFDSDDSNSGDCPRFSDEESLRPGISRRMPWAKGSRKRFLRESPCRIEEGGLSGDLLENSNKFIRLST